MIMGSVFDLQSRLTDASGPILEVRAEVLDGQIKEPFERCVKLSLAGDDDARDALAMSLAGAAKSRPWMTTALATAYATGTDVSKDPAAAARWFEVALKRDDPVAAHDFGHFIIADGCPGLSAAEGVALLKRAAAAGIMNAHAGLTIAYHRGHGVERDLAASLAHASLTAEHSPPIAAWAAALRDELTEHQRQLADAIAFFWRWRAPEAWITLPAECQAAASASPRPDAGGEGQTFCPVDDGDNPPVEEILGRKPEPTRPHVTDGDAPDDANSG